MKRVRKVFDNKRFGFDTILCEEWLPFSAILCEAIRFGTILFSAKRFDKELRWTNCFDVIFDDKDGLVDVNDNWCWKEEIVWRNIVKDVKASGEENREIKGKRI